MVIPYGKCLCGCGADTTIAKKTDSRLGHIKGQPVRYIKGHHNRLTGKLYHEEDRGFITPCWIWDACISQAGYGYTTHNGKQIPAHKASYEKKYGPIHTDLDHLCRVRECVNPDHVELVTKQMNTRRGLLTKLSDDDVLDIMNSNSHYMEVAKKYGITPQYVYQLRNGTSKRKFLNG